MRVAITRIVSASKYFLPMGCISAEKLNNKVLKSNKFKNMFDATSMFGDLNNIHAELTNKKINRKNREYILLNEIILQSYY